MVSQPEGIEKTSHLRRDACAENKLIQRIGC